MNRPEWTPEEMKQLVLRAGTGDPEAVSALYEATYSSIYYTVRSMIREEQDVLDILQDSYIKAFTHLESLGEGEKFLPWLRRIAVNTARDHLKKKRPALFSDLAGDEEQSEPVEERFVDDHAGATPEEVLDQNETRRLLREIVDSLPEDQRAVTGMYYYQELPVREIASVLGVSESAVKSRLLYARRKIETKVRELEKRGTKLYGLAPVPFLLWLIRGQEAYAAPRPDSRILGEILSGTAPAAGPASPVPRPENLAGTGAGSAAGTAAGAAAGLGAVKIACIALAAAAVIGLGVWGMGQGSRSGPEAQPAEAGAVSGAPEEEASASQAEDPVREALEQYAVIVGQADRYTYSEYSAAPTGSYRYAVVQLHPEDPVPTLLLEQETEDYMYYLRVFRYEPETGTVQQPEETLMEGVAPVGGYRGSIGLQPDGNGLCTLEVSSGTGATTVTRVTLEQGALTSTSQWSGRLDQMPQELVSRAIPWHETGDRSALENWTPESSPAEPETSGAAETDPGDGRIVFQGTIDTYHYDEVVELQGCPDPNGPWTDHEAEFRLIVLDTPQTMELQGLDSLRSDEVCLIDVTGAEGLEGYDGQHLTFSIDPTRTYWPSDTSMPVGQPSTLDVRIVD